MILITGANGHLGSTAIDFLLEKKQDAEIAGLVRSELKGKELKAKGVELRIGDYTDYDSIENAMRGIDVVALISSSELEDRIQQHKNVIDAAKKAGVKQIFYTSVVHADKLENPLGKHHHETEKLISDSGLAKTILRNTIYLEFFPMFWGNALETGKWYLPGGGHRQNFALRSEMAEALANGLANPEQHKNQVYPLTSSAAYTFEEYAEVMSEAAGKEIVYNDIPVDAYTEQLKKAGLPEEMVQASVMTAEVFVSGALDLVSDDLENLLGRKPKDTMEFVREAVTSKLEG